MKNGWLVRNVFVLSLLLLGTYTPECSCSYTHVMCTFSYCTISIASIKIYIDKLMDQFEIKLPTSFTYCFSTGSTVGFPPEWENSWHDFKLVAWSCLVPNSWRNHKRNTRFTVMRKWERANANEMWRQRRRRRRIQRDLACTQFQKRHLKN